MEPQNARPTPDEDQAQEVEMLVAEVVDKVGDLVGDPPEAR